MHSRPCGRHKNILYRYPRGTNKESDTHSSMRHPYEYSIRISSSHEKAKRYTLLLVASIRMFYMDILKPRARKAIQSCSSGSYNKFFTNILETQTKEAIHAAPSSKYTNILYEYPPDTDRENDTHSSKQQLYEYSVRVSSKHRRRIRYHSFRPRF